MLTSSQSILIWHHINSPEWATMGVFTPWKLANAKSELCTFCSLCLECSFQFSSVAQSCPTLCDPMDCSMPGFPVHHQLPELTQTHVHWVGHPTISCSVIPFSCLQSFPASGYFPRSQFFTWDGQSIGVPASASVLPMNIDWFSLGLTVLILQSKGLWESSTTKFKNVTTEFVLNNQMAL